jgi:hypothetical protein
MRDEEVHGAKFQGEITPQDCVDQSTIVLLPSIKSMMPSKTAGCIIRM